ncbi:MAG TPA: sodium/proton-translocating pyrophosphatase, partial [Candidatus Acidoferrales bacterium]|nr:sodium/proton-translocating pyrophosphatase [Candidatus Acidoferrales bacterium]
MKSWLNVSRHFSLAAAFPTARVAQVARRVSMCALSVVSLVLLSATGAFAEPTGGEASLKLPDLGSVSFFNNAINGHALLMIGILFSFFGLLFGMMIYMQLKNLPVHRAMREISELIYETCKTYLQTQGRFLAVLWIFIAAIIVLYFGFLEKMEFSRVLIILAFSVVGILGSYGVAWFGIRVNTFA